MQAAQTEGAALAFAEADMIAYLLLILAAVTRLFPIALHGVGLNVTAVGGGLLFFGSRKGRAHAAVGLAVMALTDVYLTTSVYHLAFHLSDYVVTWAWYGAVCLVGSGLLRRATAMRVGLAALCSATSFFVLSNLVVWISSGMYVHTGAGLATCFGAALPFYANDLTSTALTVSVLFGLPVVARQTVLSWRALAGRTTA